MAHVKPYFEGDPTVESVACAEICSTAVPVPDGSDYYHHWLAALERLVVMKGLSDPDVLLARKEAWADAYRRTPHGLPVELAIDGGA